MYSTCWNRDLGTCPLRPNKKKLLEAWYESRLFTQSGLDKQEIAVKVMNECRNGGDFLRIVMSEIAMKQGVERWADTTPEHILYLHRIKETIPDALVIHIIRDGRDVALSTDKLGYIRRLPLDRQPAKMAAGLYWEWMVNKGPPGRARPGRRIIPKSTSRNSFANREKRSRKLASSSNKTSTTIRSAEWELDR